MPIQTYLEFWVILIFRRNRRAFGWEVSGDILGQSDKIFYVLYVPIFEFNILNKYILSLLKEVFVKRNNIIQATTSRTLEATGV